jgi:hypothetical protein
MVAGIPEFNVILIYHEFDFLLSFLNIWTLPNFQRIY